MDMRCLGITKRFTICKNRCNLLFCSIHRIQAFLWFFLVMPGLTGDYIEIYEYFRNKPAVAKQSGEQRPLTTDNIVDNHEEEKSNAPGSASSDSAAKRAQVEKSQRVKIHFKNKLSNELVTEINYLFSSIDEKNLGNAYLIEIEESGITKFVKFVVVNKKSQVEVYISPFVSPNRYEITRIRDEIKSLIEQDDIR